MSTHFNFLATFKILKIFIKRQNSQSPKILCHILKKYLQPETLPFHLFVHNWQKYIDKY